MDEMNEMIPKVNAIECSIVDNLSHFLCNLSKMNSSVNKVIEFTFHDFNRLIRGLFFRRFLLINRTFSLYLCLLLMLTSITPILTECQFPPHWAGSWFQKGVQESIRILNSNISDKGICRESNGEKFLIENRNEKCVRCLVINERHQNLLQYKETYYCHPIKPNDGKVSLDTVCSEINGDAPLFSLFRLETRSVQCPFHGPFTFSYSRGQGECRDPISEIDSCTDDRHLLFKFKACADVYGSESRVEELECFAEWKEGSYRYLVGKLHHDSAKTDEDKFRCFVFDKIKDAPEGYEIAQSGDATCDGLVSPKDGSRTMKIHKTLGVIPRCQFPQWLTLQRHWKSLDGSHMYDFNRQNNSFVVYNITNGGDVVRLGICIHRENVSNHYSNDAFNISQYTVHFTSGCKSGYICLRIYQRTNQIIEIQYGNSVSQSSDACLHNHFKQQNVKYYTLTSMSPETRECPFEGIYAVNVPDGGLSNGVNERQSNPSSEKTLFICSEQSSQSSLNSRCNSNDHIQLQSRCSYSENTRNFKCRGGWKENETNYLIASSNEDDIRQYCLAYNENENELKMTISSETCLRQSRNHLTGTQSNRESHLALSLVNKVLCNQVSGKSVTVHIISAVLVLKIIVLLQLGHNLLISF